MDNNKNNLNKLNHWLGDYENRSIKIKDIIEKELLKLDIYKGKKLKKIYKLESQTNLTGYIQAIYKKNEKFFPFKCASFNVEINNLLLENKKSDALFSSSTDRNYIISIAFILNLTYEICNMLLSICCLEPLNGRNNNDFIIIHLLSNGIYGAKINTVDTRKIDLISNIEKNILDKNGFTHNADSKNKDLLTIYKKVNTENLSSYLLYLYEKNNEVLIKKTSFEKLNKDLLNEKLAVFVLPVDIQYVELYAKLLKLNEYEYTDFFEKFDFLPNYEFDINQPKLGVPFFKTVLSETDSREIYTTEMSDYARISDDLKLKLKKYKANKFFQGIRNTPREHLKELIAAYVKDRPNSSMTSFNSDFEEFYTYDNISKLTYVNLSINDNPDYLMRNDIILGKRNPEKLRDVLIGKKMITRKYFIILALFLIENIDKENRPAFKNDRPYKRKDDVNSKCLESESLNNLEYLNKKLNEIGFQPVLDDSINSLDIFVTRYYAEKNKNENLIMKDYCKKIFYELKMLKIYYWDLLEIKNKVISNCGENNNLAKNTEILSDNLKKDWEKYRNALFVIDNFVDDLYFYRYNRKKYKGEDDLRYEKIALNSLENLNEALSTLSKSDLDKVEGIVKAENEKLYNKLEEENLLYVEEVRKNKKRSKYIENPIYLIPKIDF